LGSSITNTITLITQPLLEDFVTNYHLNFCHKDRTFDDFTPERIYTNQKIYKHQVVSTKYDKKCQEEKKTS
jgi:hypothetical protein